MFIVAQGVVLDERTKRFAFTCANRLPQNEPPMGMFDLAVLRYHWGLGRVFDNYIQLHFKVEDIPGAGFEVEGHEGKQPNYTVLAKRERAASLWDALMEVMSMTLSVDVLRMSSDIHLPDSFINAHAGPPRAQVILLDDLPDGPLYDLWSFFSGSAPIRPSLDPEYKTVVAALLSEHTAIIPLPGHSIPLAHIGQRDVSNRDYSALARVFAARVLQNYGVLYPQDDRHTSNAVRVTLITWPGTCELRDTEHLLQALRGAFPHVIIKAVGLAAMPMAGQLKTVQSTDVLVGAHGDGLSHIMFMREGEGAVLEIQPAGVSTSPDQARYKSLAAMLGQKYFSLEAEVVASDRAGWTELSLSADEFVAQVGRAIEALGASSGGR